MEELLSFVIQVVLWYFVFKIVFALADLWVKSKYISEQRAELKEKLVKMIHYINQEKHGDLYYWFDKETDAFLAQGATEEELKKHLTSRFKDHIFVLDDNRAMYGPEMKIVTLDQLPKVFNASTKTS